MLASVGLAGKPRKPPTHPQGGTLVVALLLNGALLWLVLRLG
jgi:hypothetical protein